MAFFPSLFPNGELEIAAYDEVFALQGDLDLRCYLNPSTSCSPRRRPQSDWEFAAATGSIIVRAASWLTPLGEDVEEGALSIWQVRLSELLYGVSNEPMMRARTEAASLNHKLPSSCSTVTPLARAFSVRDVTRSTAA